MQYTLFLLIPFVLSLIFTPIVRKLAFKIGMIAMPRVDRWHKQPTALLGGISIYLACIFSALFLGIRTHAAVGLFLGATFLFIFGLIDDKVHFAPYVKLFAQIIAGCVAVLFGITIGLPLNLILLIPLTLLWIIGITNAFNLLDNIDGLAAGIAAISSLTLFLSSALIAHNPLGIFALIIFGATLGFLPYNFNPAKIFMGDSGSMFLGYSLAVISISAAPRHISNLLITMILPVFILSVPIFDTIFVMIGRKLLGRKVFEGGRDHTSHRLVTLGLSPRKTVLLLYAISTLFASVAILFSHLNLFVILSFAFLLIVVMFFLGAFLFEIDTTQKSTNLKRIQKKYSDQRVVLNNVFLHKRRIVEVFLDFVFICIAYFCAYFLRFEGDLFHRNSHLLQQSLVWVILIKMTAFFICGLYRGVWKYIGISDFFTVFKAVSAGSLLSIMLITFLFRFKDYSRAVFFIDWLVLLFLVLGSRFLFRMIEEVFSQVHNSGKRVLIFGAGDLGEMVIREIKRNKSLNYNPIGFIDDDPRKLGHKIHGVPILASRNRIKSLVSSHEIAEILVAIPSLDQQSFIELTRFLDDCGVPFKIVKSILDENKKNEIQTN
ncbi:MAG: hypothetical protein NT014_07720 [Candidatus Omnitrophica bacterium]|nr:hypothetical protein [Candidatus Omnitrophota bacterium]